MSATKEHMYTRSWYHRLISQPHARWWWVYNRSSVFGCLGTTWHKQTFNWNPVVNKTGSLSPTTGVNFYHEDFGEWGLICLSTLTRCCFISENEVFSFMGWKYLKGKKTKNKTSFPNWSQLSQTSSETDENTWIWYSSIKCQHFYLFVNNFPLLFFIHPHICCYYSSAPHYYNRMLRLWKNGFCRVKLLENCI